MSRFLLSLLFISEAFVFLSASSEITTHSVSDSRVISFPNTPPAVINEENRGKEAEPPSSIRKLGKHDFASPSQSPSEAFGPSTSQGDDGSSYGAIQLRMRRHRPVDKSIAAGGVILGGLATTFLVAIFCYIRATRRKTGEPIHV